jgi:hypothetical protein
MMAFTSTDLINIDAALVALARGKRIVRVSVGDKSFEYSDINIEKLKSFRNEIAAELSVTPRFFMISTSKGL